MSRDLTPEQAIALVPLWRNVDVSVEKAFEGLTNRSFKLRSGSDRFVLRLDATHTPALNLDREAERVALARAQAARIGPEVIYSDIELGILVTRYVAGRPLLQADLRETPVLERIAAVLRRLHALPALGTGFDIVAIAKRYLAALPGDPGMRRFGAQCVDLIDALRGAAPKSFCHCDVIAANLIASGPESHALVLIDWEYAGDTDAYFDLASLVAYHDLDARRAGILLSAYAGGATTTDRERLDAQVRVYNALHWLWLGSREAATPAAAQRTLLDRLRAKIMLSDRR